MSDENHQQGSESEQKKPSQLPDELQAEAAALLQLRSKASRDRDGDSDRTETETVLQLGPGVSDFARHIHLYVREYIRLADQKAALVFAFTSAVLAFLYNKNLHIDWLKHPKHWSALDLVIFLSMGALLIALIFAALVVLPRLTKSHVGYVFFESIKEFESASEYASIISQKDDKQLAEAILKHSYDIAIICSNKYKFFSIAIWSSAIGILLTIITLIFKS